jgi:hypothetical protein
MSLRFATVTADAAKEARATHRFHTRKHLGMGTFQILSSGRTTRALGRYDEKE